MRGQSVLAQVTGVLERCGIAFMLTGSFAGAYHGVPRATLDIDLVIDPTRAQLEAFVTRYSQHAAQEEQKFLPLAERILSRNSNHMAALGLSLHMHHIRLPISHM